MPRGSDQRLNVAATWASNPLVTLAASLALCFAVAATGAIASVDAGGFYSALERPAWAPPAWLFGPVWTVLYGAMAVSAWLVLRRPSSTARSLGLGLFLAQLLANVLWSWLFFAWRLGAWSFVDIVALWLLIAATLLAFLRVRVGAALLLVPYLAWVSFAAVLNWMLWTTNSGLLGGLFPVN